MNARYYSPYINRFISADTIVPNPTNPQSYNRYSYGYNNPVKYSDPSGHCAVDASGNIALDEAGNLAKTDCTIQNFQNLTWEQRKRWLELFVGQHDFDDWFNDIISAIGILSSDSDYQDMDGWAAYMDAGVLQAINDGMRLYEGQDAIGSAISDGHTYSLVHGGSAWKEFFDGYYAGMDITDLNSLIVLRLAGEQGGVNYARSLPLSEQRYDSEDLRVRIKIDLFLGGADTYRSFGQWCRGGFSCNSAYTDPRQATGTDLFRVLGQLPEGVSWVLYSLTVSSPSPIIGP